MTTATKKIDFVETTDLNLTGRAGLAPVSRFLNNSGLIDALAKDFSGLSKNEKGTRPKDFFKQMGSFFFNGENLRISQFDQYKLDPSYASLLDLDQEDLSSSAAIRRYFKKFDLGCSRKFRRFLKKIFRKILKDLDQDHILLTLDSMVLDNDYSKVKQGCTPSYKKVKGYQPLHLIINGVIVDMTFRGGKTNGNCGNTAKNMILNAIKLIREIKGKKIPIIFNMDSGFMDHKLFDAIEGENAKFICGGKKYDDIKQIVSEASEESWDEFNNGKKVWKYLEFNSKCKIWKKEYRTIYTYLWSEEDGSCLLNFGETENVIYTNIEKKPKPKDPIKSEK